MNRPEETKTETATLKLEINDCDQRWTDSEGFCLECGWPAQAHASSAPVNQNARRIFGEWMREAARVRRLNRSRAWSDRVEHEQSKSIRDNREGARAIAQAFGWIA